METIKKNKVELIKDACGKRWYLNDQLHCEDGPAVEWPNGDKEWFLNGKRHREDGAAVIWYRGNRTIRYWYLNDKKITKKEFEKRTEIKK